ncbi:hypothetical protein BDV33DRAFT_210875 [Aspergillus novoparasiticus]|uniref:Uncharacterized protein n=1 Tax=Aspergillus novoparasiticus TaxID=986946 RepID=A0A5N6E696_9EURO|nr:hypothetical protein BDV33DRAFT_210875 [Aspergillus novoparasiticus]
MTATDRGYSLSSQSTPLSSSSVDSNESYSLETDSLSETTEDDSFIVSDREESDDSSSADDTVPFSPAQTVLDMDEENLYKGAPSKDVRPIRVIARRTALHDDRQVVQYLVLWYSWETAENPIVSGR